MKKALIFGNRICQIESEIFPVAEPLHWVDVDDDVQPHTHEWRDGAAVPIPEPEPQAPVIPDVVTMRQARLALLQMGKLDDAEAAIAAIEDESLRRAAQIEWGYAHEIARGHPIVQQVAATLEISDADMDAFFTLAGGL